MGYGVCRYGYGVGKPDLQVTRSKPYWCPPFLELGSRSCHKVMRGQFVAIQSFSAIFAQERGLSMLAVTPSCNSSCFVWSSELIIINHIRQWNICICLLSTQGCWYYINMGWEGPCNARWLLVWWLCVWPLSHDIYRGEGLNPGLTSLFFFFK